MIHFEVEKTETQRKLNNKEWRTWWRDTERKECVYLSLCPRKQGRKGSKLVGIRHFWPLQHTPTQWLTYCAFYYLFKAVQKIYNASGLKGGSNAVCYAYLLYLQYLSSYWQHLNKVLEMMEEQQDREMLWMGAVSFNWLPKVCVSLKK